MPPDAVSRVLSTWRGADKKYVEGILPQYRKILLNSRYGDAFYFVPLQTNQSGRVSTIVSGRAAGRQSIVTSEQTELPIVDDKEPMDSKTAEKIRRHWLKNFEQTDVAEELGLDRYHVVAAVCQGLGTRKQLTPVKLGWLWKLVKYVELDQTFTCRILNSVRDNQIEKDERKRVLKVMFSAQCRPSELLVVCYVYFAVDSGLFSQHMDEWKGMAAKQRNGAEFLAEMQEIANRQVLSFLSFILALVPLHEKEEENERLQREEAAALPTEIAAEFVDFPSIHKDLRRSKADKLKAIQELKQRLLKRRAETKQSLARLDAQIDSNAHTAAQLERDPGLKEVVSLEERLKILCLDPIVPPTISGGKLHVQQIPTVRLAAGRPAWANVHLPRGANETASSALNDSTIAESALPGSSTSRSSAVPPPTSSSGVTSTSIESSSNDDDPPPSARPTTRRRTSTQDGRVPDTLSTYRIPRKSVLDCPNDTEIPSTSSEPSADVQSTAEVELPAPAQAEGQRPTTPSAVRAETTEEPRVRPLSNNATDMPFPDNLLSDDDDVPMREDYRSLSPSEDEAEVEAAAPVLDEPPNPPAEMPEPMEAVEAGLPATVKEEELDETLLVDGFLPRSYLTRRAVVDEIRDRILNSGGANIELDPEELWLMPELDQLIDPALLPWSPRQLPLITIDSDDDDEEEDERMDVEEAAEAPTEENPPDGGQSSAEEMPEDAPVDQPSTSALHQETAPAEAVLPTVEQPLFPPPPLSTARPVLIKIEVLEGLLERVEQERAEAERLERERAERKKKERKERKKREREAAERAIRVKQEPRDEQPTAPIEEPQERAAVNDDLLPFSIEAVLQQAAQEQAERQRASNAVPVAIPTVERAEEPAVVQPPSSAAAQPNGPLIVKPELVDGRKKKKKKKKDREAPLPVVKQEPMAVDEPPPTNGSQEGARVIISEHQRDPRRPKELPVLPPAAPPAPPPAADPPMEREESESPPPLPRRVLPPGRSLPPPRQAPPPPAVEPSMSTGRRSAPRRRFKKRKQAGAGGEPPPKNPRT
ncbi:hypothetical protein M3Y99_00658200 [Aphelenchoides fujianensis]|nr:hypothetical protein M3Y99_00658200 [Aphelenchoides fujianensis]